MENGEWISRQIKGGWPARKLSGALAPLPAATDVIRSQSARYFEVHASHLCTSFKYRNILYFRDKHREFNAVQSKASQSMSYMLIMDESQKIRVAIQTLPVRKLSTLLVK